MTREEAYNRIDAIIAKHEIDDVYVTITNFMDYDALRMAREILEQEPCEDCISREEVCDYIAEFVNHEYATDREREMVKHIIGGIQHLPSIQPTVKENLVVGDCISRKAVMDYIKDCTVDLGCVNGTNMVLDVISNMPSIQPKSKTDEPMQVELEGDGYADGELVYDYGKCPKCGWDFEYGDKDWEEPYCCHCGQKLHWFESEE